MKKNRRSNSGKVASSVNPQGLSEDAANHRPNTVLEDRAKKKNTKI